MKGDIREFGVLVIGLGLMIFGVLSITVGELADPAIFGQTLKDALGLFGLLFAIFGILIANLRDPGTGRMAAAGFFGCLLCIAGLVGFLALILIEMPTRNALLFQGAAAVAFFGGFAIAAAADIKNGLSSGKIPK